MFGRRWREAQLEAVREALAADEEARRSLADAMHRIDARLADGLREQELNQRATESTVQHLRATVADSRTDLARAVEHLAQICALLGEQIEAGRAERQLLLTAVRELAAPAPPERPRPAERVLGGSFPASADTAELGAGDEPRRSQWA